MSAPTPTRKITPLERGTAEYVKANGIKVDHCIESAEAMTALKKRVNTRCAEWGLTEQFDQLKKETASLNPLDYRNYSSPDSYLYLNMAQLLNVTAEYELNDGKAVFHKIPHLAISSHFEESAAVVIEAMKEKSKTELNPDLNIALSDAVAKSDPGMGFNLLCRVVNGDDVGAIHPVANYELFRLFIILATRKEAPSTAPESAKTAALLYRLKSDFKHLRNNILGESANLGFAPAQQLMANFTGEPTDRLSLVNLASERGSIPATYSLIKMKAAEELNEGDVEALLFMARKAYIPAQLYVLELTSNDAIARVFADNIDREELEKHSEFAHSEDAAKQAQAEPEVTKQLHSFLNRRKIARDLKAAGLAATTPQVSTPSSTAQKPEARTPGKGLEETAVRK